MLVLLLFFCSGATALIYEVLWSKYLTLMLGSTVQAQTVVLAVFMGGLATGNRLFGKRSKSAVEPLRTYGILELIIGLYAFAFPRLFRAGDWIFVQAGSAVVDIPVLPLILKLALSVFLLLAPTILMGGTLPLVAEWIQRRRMLDASGRVGIFYAVNSLGAVAGSGLAGFYLIQTFGLVSTAELTALANILVGLAAAIISKRESLQLSKAGAQKDAEPPPAAPAAGISLGALVALTGGVSMGLEVLSSRALAMIAGGSLQSFALVLMSFILGIGLGSAVISSSRAARQSAASMIYLLLLSGACLVVIHVVFIEQWTIAYANAKYGLAPNEIGYIWHQIAVGLFSFIFLGLPAAFLGAIVPLAIRAGNLSASSLGDQVGRLLTWNTLGAVAGVLVTGFVLMPALGLRAAFTFLALVLIAAAGAIAVQRKQRPVALASLVLGLIAIAAAASTASKWRTVISSGVFRVRNLYLTSETFDRRKREVELLYYKDSPDATVSIEKGIGTNGIPQLTLRLNGKSDASTAGDLATQYLLAHLPMAARPGATNVFVLGFGSGITAGALLGHPIQRLTVAENCEPVLEAGKLFAPWNRGVLTNTRARILQDDARSVLKLRPDHYDVIISEPSNPWVVGIGSVFSQDFYNLCASRLGDQGVMAQWFHRYEMSDDIVFLIFRTFASVFPNMEIWDTQEGDLVLLGSMQPWPSNPERYQAIFERPEPAHDLASVGIGNASLLWARQVASQKSAAAVAGDGPLQTDEFPLLEYAAPRAFFVGSQANRMYLFDERTLQFPLADSNKVAALRAIPKETLVESFATYGPSNPSLRVYLQSLKRAPLPQKIDPMAYFIFRPPESYPADPTTGSHAAPELIECVRTEGRLLRGEGAWRDNVRTLEQVLTRMIAANNVNPPDYKPEYFAALGARFAIGQGDYHIALECLRLGFVFNSSDEQLAYLSRVLDKIVPPDLMKRLRQTGKTQE